MNRLDLEDKINDAINDFPSLDEYWKTYAPDWTMSEDLPRVSVYKKEIGWGLGTSRVTSECVTLMAIRPVCVLYKHIINECKGLFHYDFIPTGTAAMTTSEQVKDLLINNNDIQNSIQGISVMGLPEMALYLEYGHNNQVKTIKQWILHHPGVETMESTDESSTDGRWIVIVLREEFDSAKTWIEEILNQIPEIMPEFDYKVFASKFEVFPPALFTNAPLGGKMQKDVNDTYARVMAKKDRYTKTESKKSGNAWQPRTPIFFDATPENFPTLGKQKKNQDRPSGDEANSIESTVKTTPTRTAQTIISTEFFLNIHKCLKNSCRTRRNKGSRTGNKETKKEESEMPTEKLSSNNALSIENFSNVPRQKNGANAPKKNARMMLASSGCYRNIKNNSSKCSNLSRQS